MEQTEAPARTSRLYPAVGVLFLMLFAVQGASFVIDKSVTYDEGAHLAAGISAWKTGDFRIFNTNPPLVRMIATLPLLAMDVTVPLERGWDLRQGMVLINEIAGASPPPFHRLVMAARWPVLLMTLGLGLLVWRDVRRHFGEPAGLVAAALFATQPMLVAYGSILMVDAGAALFLYLAVRTFIIFHLRGWSWTRAAIMGLALGAALAAKFTNLSLLFSLPLIALVPAGRPRSRPLRAGAMTLVALLVALLFINADYGFQGTFHRLDSQEFKSRPLAAAARLLPGALPIPLPSELTAGFDRQSVMNEQTGGAKARTFINGEWREGRQPFIFFYFAAIKLTLPLLILAVIGLALVGKKCLRAESRKQLDPWTSSFTIAALVHFGMVSFGAENYFSFRYILGIVPFLIFLSGFALRTIIDRAPGSLHAGVTAPLLVVIFSWSGAALTYPDYLAYTNLLIGSEERAYRLDPDNCRDWGQDLIELKRWWEIHPGGTLYLGYYGSIDPAYYGLDWTVPPLGPAAGTWAVSTTNLQAGLHYVSFLRNNAVFTIPSEGPYFDWLKGRRPTSRVGQIYLYEIGPNDPALRAGPTEAP